MLPARSKRGSGSPRDGSGQRPIPEPSIRVKRRTLRNPFGRSTAAAWPRFTRSDKAAGRSSAFDRRSPAPRPPAGTARAGAARALLPRGRADRRFGCGIRRPDGRTGRPLHRPRLNRRWPNSQRCLSPATPIGHVGRRQRETYSAGSLTASAASLCSLFSWVGCIRAGHDQFDVRSNCGAVDQPVQGPAGADAPILRPTR